MSWLLLRIAGRRLEGECQLPIVELRSRCARAWRCRAAGGLQPPSWHRDSIWACLRAGQRRALNTSCCSTLRSSGRLRRPLSLSVMSLSSINLQQLVSDWLALQRAGKSAPEYKQLFWAHDRAWYLCDESPNEAWDFILAALAQDCSNTTMENLSAGPLEDLLAKHGSLMIERVELQSRQDPQFARLLGGVWRNAMSEDVWRRVQRAQDRRGWDGNTET